jgi:hypothetical protein
MRRGKDELIHGEPLNLRDEERAKLPKLGRASRNARNATAVGRAPSPMRKIEHAIGPNVGGLDRAAVAAHTLPESPAPQRAHSKAAMNTPPAPSVSTAGESPAESTSARPDKGQE